MKQLIQNHNDETLLSLFIEAHEKSAIENNNASFCALLNSGITTGKLENGLASAIMTLSGHHAPIKEARQVYKYWTKTDIEKAISSNILVPGFGNSFYKESIDPKWEPIAEYIKTKYPDYYNRLNELTKWMVELNISIFPNAAMYSAIVCEILNVLHGTEVALLILARLPIWTLAWYNNNDSYRLLKL